MTSRKNIRYRRSYWYECSKCHAMRYAFRYERYLSRVCRKCTGKPVDERQLKIFQSEEKMRESVGIAARDFIERDVLDAYMGAASYGIKTGLDHKAIPTPPGV